MAVPVSASLQEMAAAIAARLQVGAQCPACLHGTDAAFAHRYDTSCSVEHTAESIHVCYRDTYGFPEFTS